MLKPSRLLIFRGLCKTPPQGSFRRGNLLIFNDTPFERMRVLQRTHFYKLSGVCYFCDTLTRDKYSSHIRSAGQINSLTFKLTITHQLKNLNCYFYFAMLL